MNPHVILKGMQAPVAAGMVALATALSPVALNAADVNWVATTGQTSAWLAPTGWSGGAMPLAGDVAIFNNTGAAAIGYSMYHNLNPTPGSANIGALWLTGARTTNDLAIETNSSSSNVFFYHGATVSGEENVILRNDSARNLVLRPVNAANPSSIRLTDSRESRVVISGAGNIAIRSALVGDDASLVVHASGAGSLELGGRGGTYSGGTTLEAGRLLITADHAAGTGALLNQGGTVEVAEGVVIANDVVHQTEGAIFKRQLGVGASFAGANLQASGVLGEVHVVFLGGSVASGGTLEASFSGSALAMNDADRKSAVLNLELPGRDLYVVSFTGDAAQGMIGWLDEGEWKNAVEGNLTTGTLAIDGFEGSFAASGALATADYLGSWGYDAATRTGWAVLDHGGSFSVVAIPEPGVVALAALGGMLLLSRCWKASATQ